MAIKPEDVRRDLEARQRSPDAPESAALSEAAAAPAAAVADDRIVKAISASYFLLRRGLAGLAFAFPILLWLGAGSPDLQASISAYYHYSAAGPSPYGGGTMRDLFVGVLWAVGAFLFFYKGYSWKENWALNVAGIAAVLVAMLPMDWSPVAGADPSRTAILHQASAVTFFLAIAYVCLFDPGETLEIMNDRARRQRFRRGYRVLGALMVLIPLGLVALHFLMPVTADRSPVVLLVEVAAIYVFSAYWLVKSREIRILERQ